MNFGIDVDRRADAVVITPLGDLDMAATPAFRQTIIKVLADGDDRIVVRLSSVDFCDSAGLGALVGALKRVRARGGDLVVCSPSESMANLFALCSLDRVFTLHASPEAAIAAVGAVAP